MSKKLSVHSGSSQNQLGYKDSYEGLSKNPEELLVQTKTEIDGVQTIILHSKMRWMLFSLFLFMTTLVNVDHGIVPAATDDIEKDLKIGETQLGLFGSLVFLGNLIGSIFSFALMNKYNRKLLLVVSLILNGVCLYTFTLTTAYWFLVINRIVVGIFQVNFKY